MIISMLDDQNIAKAYKSLKDTHYNYLEKNNVLLQLEKDIAMKLIAECNESNGIYPELVRVFVKPCQGSILKQFIEGNETLNPSFQELTKLPFIQDLQDRFREQKLTNEQLEIAFNKALKEQEIGIRDKIMNFFHTCYKWIYEKLIGHYYVKSTLEEKRDAKNGFQSFVQDTKSQIAPSKK